MSKKSICFIRSGKVETIVGLDGLLFEHFVKVFDEVFFLDVSKVFTSKFLCRQFDNDKEYHLLPGEFKVVCPKNLSELRGFLRSNNIVVISNFSETWPDWWIHHYLRKYSIPMVYINTHSRIVTFIYNKAKKDPLFIRFFNRIKGFHSHFLRFSAARFFLHDVDTLFISRKDKAEWIRSSSKARHNNSEVVITNSRFYDSFLANDCNITNDYVVFLDSILPYTEDQTRFGYQPIDRRLYYENLARVLKIIAATLSKEVVVCLHPKYDDANIREDYGDVKTVKYRTDEFIAKAELVLFHETTSINTAILYKKKIVQLTGSFFNDFTKNNCKAFQKLFSFPTLDIFESDDNNIIKIMDSLQVNEQEYDAYISNCAIASGQVGVPSCEQIANHIGHKYGIKKRN